MQEKGTEGNQILDKILEESKQNSIGKSQNILEEYRKEQKKKYLQGRENAKRALRKKMEEIGRWRKKDEKI